MQPLKSIKFLGQDFLLESSSNYWLTMHHLTTIHKRDQLVTSQPVTNEQPGPTNNITSRSTTICASHYSERGP